MTELWIGSIAATVAACIWAAWGPKVLLGTIMTPIVIVAMLIGLGMHEETQRQAQRHLEFDDLIPKKSAGTFDAVPFDPDAFLKGGPRK